MNAPTYESRTDNSTESTEGAAPENSAEEANRQKAVGSTLSWVIALFGTGVGAGILFFAAQRRCLRILAARLRHRLHLPVGVFFPPDLRPHS